MNILYGFALVIIAIATPLVTFKVTAPKHVGEDDSAQGVMTLAAMVAAVVLLIMSIGFFFPKE